MPAYPPPLPPNYVMLNNPHGSGRPPPYPQRRHIPPYEGNRSRRGCCHKCICCFCCLLFILICLISGLLLYAYTFYKPKLPSYKLSGFEVTAFDPQPDFSLYTEFLVTVRAENPNRHIGLTYKEGSVVSILFRGSELCSGKLPNFHQGHKNVTMIKVVLKGKTMLGSGLQEALMESKHGGRIPVIVSVKAPVVIVIGGDFPLRQFTVNVNCTMVVNNLTPGKKPSILSTDYSYGFEF
ncbi:hypothetical protein Nepgr_009064 [Nepenthes gracilis]|uniref:Late embryogenesis abundant protein LEA-2 subgroup domain-containing protein n=1 Tax=Nepenthes gracilis TaxID=150966 RepID=A0AAD3SAQ8_NEPGR|nr:hypothetical protein Nepgr_009064 [Nepenthes gracilis]